MISPSKWKEFSLGELAEYLNGKTFKPAEWGKQGLPIIRIQNLTNSQNPFNYFNSDVADRYVVNSGDLLISWSATLGSFIWDRGPAVLNQHIFRVVPNQKLIDKEFLHFLVLNRLDEMTKHSHGLAMKHITKKKLEALKVTIPPITEQRRIVARIKECMKRVEEIKVLRAKSIEEADATLPSMLNEAFLDLFDAYEKAEIGEVAAETRYGTSKKCSTTLGGIPILRIPNVAGGFINFDELKYCQLDRREQERIILQKGDLLFVRTNGSRDLVGRCAVYEGNGVNSRHGFASYLIRVRLDQDRIRPQFLAFFLNSTYGRSELNKRRRTSAGQFNINSENLRNIKIPLPPIDVQKQIIDNLNGYEGQVNHLQRELRKASEEDSHLREAILRKAFAGEL